jgi:hypothetical protein
LELKEKRFVLSVTEFIFNKINPKGNNLMDTENNVVSEHSTYKNTREYLKCGSKDLGSMIVDHNIPYNEYLNLRQNNDNYLVSNTRPLSVTEYQNIKNEFFLNPQNRPSLHYFQCK